VNEYVVCPLLYSLLNEIVDFCFGIFLSFIFYDRQEHNIFYSFFFLSSYFEGFVFLWRVYRGGEREFTPTHTSNFVVWVDLEGPVIYIFFFYLSLWLLRKLVWHFVNKGCVQSSFLQLSDPCFSIFNFFKKIFGIIK
jgi:hypothetical protein